jgi:murein DD-endopeptidase MepM/ murein hydrolase activator NlpD
MMRNISPRITKPGWSMLPTVFSVAGTILFFNNVALAQQSLASLQSIQSAQAVTVAVTPPKLSDGTAKVAITNTDMFPHIVFVQIFNKNAKKTPVAEISTTVKPFETLKLDAKPQVPKAVFEPGLQWVTYQDIGDLGPAVKDNHFQLPFAPNTKVRVCQSADGPQTTHGGEKIDAVDFCVAEKTPIVAARAGVVIAVVQHFTEGGMNPALLLKANTIRILHRDGLISVYSHIYTNSATVKVGQQVQQGQQIALEGNVGYSSGPHLHFEVLEGQAKLNSQQTLFHLVPIRFFNKNNNEIKIKHDTYYTADGLTSSPGASQSK